MGAGRGEGGCVTQAQWRDAGNVEIIDYHDLVDRRQIMP